MPRLSALEVSDNPAKQTPANYPGTSNADLSATTIYGLEVLLEMSTVLPHAGDLIGIPHRSGAHADKSQMSCCTLGLSASDTLRMKSDTTCSRNGSVARSLRAVSLLGSPRSARLSSESTQWASMDSKV